MIEICEPWASLFLLGDALRVLRRIGGRHLHFILAPEYKNLARVVEISPYQLVRNSKAKEIKPVGKLLNHSGGSLSSSFIARRNLTIL